MRIEKLQITICWIFFIINPLFISCLDYGPCDSDLQCTGLKADLKCCKSQCQNECFDEPSQAVVSGTIDVKIGTGVEESSESHKLNSPKVETADSTQQTVEDEKTGTQDKFMQAQETPIPAHISPDKRASESTVKENTDQTIIKNAETPTDVNTAEKLPTVGENKDKTVSQPIVKESNEQTVVKNAEMSTVVNVKAEPSTVVENSDNSGKKADNSVILEPVKEVATDSVATKPTNVKPEPSPEDTVKLVDPTNEKSETVASEPTFKQSQAQPDNVDPSMKPKTVSQVVASAAFKIGPPKPEAADLPVTKQDKTPVVKPDTESEATSVSEDEFQPAGGKIFDDKEWDALFEDLDFNYWDDKEDYDYEDDDKFFDYFDLPDYEDDKNDENDDENDDNQNESDLQNPDDKTEDEDDDDDHDHDDKVPKKDNPDNLWNYDYDYWMDSNDDYDYYDGDYQNAYDYAMKWYEEYGLNNDNDINDGHEKDGFEEDVDTTGRFYHWAFLGLVVSVVILMFYMILRFFFDYNIFPSKSASGWTTLNNEEERIYSNANYVNMSKEA